MFQYQPPQEAVKILYQDDDLLFVDKPAGLLSVPGRQPKHKDCLFTRLQCDRSEVLLVHRLDMDTSGVMVFALNPAAQRHLGREFSERKVHKTYISVVYGAVEPRKNCINLPLTADWPNRPLQKVCFENGKPSKTFWQLLDTSPSTSRLQLTPVSGRSHQLRVHLKESGHPILGDRFYAPLDVQAMADRLMLHAESLTLAHPATQQPLTIRSPAPF